MFGGGVGGDEGGGEFLCASGAGVFHECAELSAIELDAEAQGAAFGRGAGDGPAECGGAGVCDSSGGAFADADAV